MNPAKNIAVSFRVSERFKLLLEAAAKAEGRSRTNMLETLLYAFCEERGITTEPGSVRKQKSKGSVKP
jgi:hypothetical protein